MEGNLADYNISQTLNDVKKILYKIYSISYYL